LADDLNHRLDVDRLEIPKGEFLIERPFLEKMGHSDPGKFSRNCWEKLNAEGSRIGRIYENMKIGKGKYTRCWSKGFYEMKICYHKIKKSEGTK